jgi:hypothetical protein
MSASVAGRPSARVSQARDAARARPENAKK